MRIKRLTLGIFLGLNLFSPITPSYAMELEEQWTQSWGGSGYEQFDSVIKTSDGGLVAVGKSDSTNTEVTNQGGYDAILIKYDSNGKQQWIQSWGGNNDDSFTSIIETSDGGLVAVGKSDSTNTEVTNQGGYDAILIKYDSNGKQQWIQSWGGNNDDSFTSIIETSDGGLAVVGGSRSTNAGFINEGNMDAVLIKYNSKGQRQWIQSWGGSYTDIFHSVTETSDGGFAVVGESDSTNAGFIQQGGGSDAVLVKYNSMGQRQWIQSWGGVDANDTFNSIIETSDKSLIVGGSSWSTTVELMNRGESDAILIKYDNNGKKQWIQSWGGNQIDSFQSIVKSSDEGIFAVGFSHSTDTKLTNNGKTDAILIKYDTDGNEQWIQSWGGSDFDGFMSVVKNLDSDVDLIVVGYSESKEFANKGERDAILIRYSPVSKANIKINGNIQATIADVTIPSLIPDLVIDPNSPEGAISPEFSIENQSNAPIRLELKAFEQITNSFNDVLPNKYDSWEGLNKNQSKDIALGLIAKEGDGWQQLTTPISYVANHVSHELGVVKPASSVSFEFDVHHGRAFSESKTVQYRMVFVFDLLD